MDVDKKLERMGEKGHRYVKKSFERRRERIRKKWLAKAAEIMEQFREYLKREMGCGE
ncbi:MAG: hypothetical protein PWP76_577 [Candidatus Diapherotrites archaeon]|nr:hypothetical protein [Candidatus Diapherotrites archaeon]MDN5367155.1 hypothetical protein [Candidatus Diapherotrites archaeon]